MGWGEKERERSDKRGKQLFVSTKPFRDMFRLPLLFSKEEKTQEREGKEVL